MCMKMGFKTQEEMALGVRRSWKVGGYGRFKGR